MHKDKARAFMAMHWRKRGFLMPNGWDVGTAVVLASEGFEAIGTSSAGIAFSLGKPDSTCVTRARRSAEPRCWSEWHVSLMPRLFQSTGARRRLRSHAWSGGGHRAI